MIKIRDAKYCNIKLLLMFLVIYGHLIESQIGQSGIASAQYGFIYYFHMPAFSFLSGLFIKDCKTCVQQLKKLVPLYIALQILCVLCGGGAVKFVTPWWILWYLLSLSCWLGITWLWFRLANGKRKLVILLIAVAMGCVAGYVDFVNRTFSLSRTVVFFPYFWLGIISDNRTEWKKYRIAGIITLFGSIVMIFLLSNQLSTSFLYHATPYGNMAYGALYRLACYFIGAAMILFLLTWIPDKRFPFTKAGTDTMPAYIFHAPFSILVRELYLPWYACLVATAIFLWILCRITQWNGTIYSITSSVRRDNRCLLFRKYTKNTEDGYMDSCYHSPETRC